MTVKHDLPDSLAEIAEVIGLDAALRLADTKGGQRIYVPASCGDDHWLVATLGRAAADRLCAHYRVGASNRPFGATIAIPLAGRGRLASARAEAYRALDAALAAGASVEEAVAASGLSRATVLRARRRRSGPDPAPLLALMRGERPD